MQDAVHANWPDDVRLRSGFDERMVMDIARHCGSPALAREAGYLRAARFRAGRRFLCRTGGDSCFYAGTICRGHFRLLMIAVREDRQREGLGTLMMREVFALCRRRGLSRITLRTAREGGALAFYSRFGARVTGIRGGDYEMEMAAPCSG